MKREARKRHESQHGHQSAFKPKEQPARQHHEGKGPEIKALEHRQIKAQRPQIQLRGLGKEHMQGEPPRQRGDDAHHGGGDRLKRL